MSLVRAAATLSALILPAIAHAGSGPCGIQTGTWTANKTTCDRIKAGGHNIGGQDSYMSFGTGGRWAQWESFCQIHHPALRGAICSLDMHCSVEGTDSVEHTSFKIISPTTIAFGDDNGSYTARYTLCATKPFSPYFDLD